MKDTLLITNIIVAVFGVFAIGLLIFNFKKTFHIVKFSKKPRLTLIKNEELLRQEGESKRKRLK